MKKILFFSVASSILNNLDSSPIRLLDDAKEEDRPDLQFHNICQKTPIH